MIEQPRYQRYISGYLSLKDEFIRNEWADVTNDRKKAINEAVRYTRQGNETLAGFGVDAQLRPAIVLRKVYYDESEPEVVE